MAYDKAVDSAVLDDGLTSVADAIRQKGGTSASLAFPQGFVDAVDAIEAEETYEWVKPAEWPDLESVPLPGSWTESTVYLLFDRSCGMDAVDIEVTGVTTIYKGTVSNGAFVGEEVASYSTANTFSDTLTQDYMVYKIVTTGQHWRFTTAHRIVNTTYQWCDEGLVWIYGEIPTLDEVSSNNASPLTPYLRRISYTHVGDGVFFTWPINAQTSGGYPDTSVSYEVGYEEPGDFHGQSITRTGNGSITPPIKQKSELIIKNADFGTAGGAARSITARKVRLKNCSGSIGANWCQANRFLESLIVEGGTLAVTDCYYLMSAYNLRICDLSGVDFSGATRSSSAFNQAYLLETLVLNDTWAMDLNLSNQGLLTKESVLGLFRDLPTITTTHTITLSGYVKWKLTAEEIAIATAKGWTVA